jgi:2-polyprenyl-3-methyl-5-hydroxy-6-metoxy-1,4-benzoquinol methylase
MRLSAESSAYDRLALARHRAYSQLLGRERYRLLEIGCGSAGLAKALASVGVEYEGLEIDPRMVESSKARGVGTVVQGDLLSFDSDKKYDVVAASQVLEHIVSPRGFVARAHALLVPGGVLHLDVPNHDSLAGRVMGPLSGGQRVGGLSWPHHAIAYRATTLRTLLSRTFDEMQVFDACPDDEVWGKAGEVGLAAQMFYRLARATGAGSMLVALARKHS